MSEDRLAALRRAALLDEAAREAWNRLAWLAGQLLRAPIAIVVLFGERGPVIVSACGTGVARIAPPESWPFGTSIDHILTVGTPIVIEDVTRHENRQHNDAVRELGGNACISVPLRTSDRHPLGSVCVLDRRARKWTVGDAALLTQLGEHAATEVGLRLRIAELEREIALPPTEVAGPVPSGAVEDAIVGHDELTGL